MEKIQGIWTIPTLKGSYFWGPAENRGKKPKTLFNQKFWSKNNLDYLGPLTFIRGVLCAKLIWLLE
jgi:hypothetical protein